MKAIQSMVEWSDPSFQHAADRTEALPRKRQNKQNATERKAVKKE